MFKTKSIKTRTVTGAKSMVDARPAWEARYHCTNTSHNSNSKIKEFQL